MKRLLNILTNMSPIDLALKGIAENRPILFRSLLQKLCDHSEATKDDDGNIIHCSLCGQMDEAESY